MSGPADKPVLFVTNHVPPDRVGAFQALHAAQDIELALFGGRLHHATAGVEDPGVPFRRIRQREAHALAASGRHRAVIASSAGRVAVPATYSGARRAGIPFVYWTGIWGQIRTPAHLAAIPLTRAIERHADAVVTYGPHVSAHVAAHGAHNIHVAPQAVDNAFWAAAADPRRARASAGDPEFLALYAGRATPAGKGLDVLLDAWRRTGLAAPDAALVLAGVEPGELPNVPGMVAAGRLDPAEMRNFYAAADVLVVPSIPTRDFLEPWALVANEAMNQRTPIIATEAVGAAAGGLVRDGANGLVVPAGDAGALAHAIERLRADASLRARLAAEGARDVANYDYSAWVQGFSQALATVSADRGAC